MTSAPGVAPTGWETGAKQGLGAAGGGWRCLNSGQAQTPAEKPIVFCLLSPL